LNGGELGKKNDLGGNEAKTFEGFAKGLQVSSTRKFTSRLPVVVREGLVKIYLAYLTLLYPMDKGLGMK
jgi:hypothetical protein